MPGSHNEVFSLVLIEKALEFSGWGLLVIRQRLESLFQSVLHRAFNGEL